MKDWKWKSFKTVRLLQVVSLLIEFVGMALICANIESDNILPGMLVFLVGYFTWQYSDILEWEVIYE